MLELLKEINQKFTLDQKEYFFNQLYKSMLITNNTSIYGWKIAKGINEYLKSCQIVTEQKNILELGGGKPLSSGIYWIMQNAKVYCSIDKFIDTSFTNDYIENIVESIRLQHHNPNFGDILRKEDDYWLINNQKIQLIKDDFLNMNFTQGYDIIYSNAVLEHVSDPESFINKSYEVMNNNGYAYHNIDLREHHTNLKTVENKDTSIDYYKYTSDEWNQMYPPGTPYYINRCIYSELLELFKKAGFEIIKATGKRTRSLDNSVYNQISDEFKKYSIDDLELSGMNILVKKL